MRFLRRWVFSRLFVVYLVAAAFLGIGAGLVRGPLGELPVLLELERASIAAEATVARRTIREDGDGQRSHVLAVTFPTAAGEGYAPDVPVTRGVFEQVAVGTRVRVLYPPSDPSKAVVDLAQRERAVVVPLVFAVVFLLVSGWVFFRALRDQARCWRIHDHGRDAEARVVAIHSSRDAEGDLLWTVEWEGVAPDRRRITGRSGPRWRDPSRRFPVGSTIRIRYLPADTSQSVWQDDLAGPERNAPHRPERGG